MKPLAHIAALAVLLLVLILFVWSVVSPQTLGHGFAELDKGLFFIAAVAGATAWATKS